MAHAPFEPPIYSKRSHPAELNRRAFPDIDLTLHCVAVKAADELRKLWKQDELSGPDIRQLTDLTNLLLIIKKQLPGATRKKAEPAITPAETKDIFE